MIWGYPYFWKHPYIYIYVYIYIYHRITQSVFSGALLTLDHHQVSPNDRFSETSKRADFWVRRSFFSQQNVEKHGLLVEIGKNKSKYRTTQNSHCKLNRMESWTSLAIWKRSLRSCQLALGIDVGVGKFAFLEKSPNQKNQTFGPKIDSSEISWPRGD